MNSTRLTFVDWYKSILILLVIVGHTNLIEGAGGGTILMSFIYSFHIPAFFIISGYLSNYEKPRTGLISSSKYLISSVIIYNIVLYCRWIVSILFKNDLNNYSLFDLTISPIIGIFWLNYEDTTYYVMARPFWFVWVLIMIKFIYKYLYKSRFFFYTYFILSLLYIYMMNKYGIKTYYYIDRIVVAMPFFAFGVMLRKTNIVSFYNSIVQKIYYILFYSCIIGVSYYYSCHNCTFRYDMNGLDFGDSIFVYYVTSAATSFALMKLCVLLPYNKTIELISKGTIPILALHMTLLGWCYKITFLHFDIIFISQAIIVIGLCIPIIILGNKYPLIGRYLLGKNNKDINLKK